MPGREVLVGPPATKYTTADVTRHPNLRQVAEDYLREYAGSFDPLVTAQAIMRKGYRIPDGGIRIVLNCMRNDMKVYDQLPPVERFELPDSREARAVKIRYSAKPCPETHEHPSHTWQYPENDSVRYVCNGVPFSINRSGYVYAKAAVKVPLLTARQGGLVHRNASVTEMVHTIVWRVPNHKMGWGHDTHPTVTLHVIPRCGRPRSIAKPILFAEDRLLEVISGSATMAPRNLCKRCFPNGALDL